jgi:hypothetical protein
VFENALITRAGIEKQVDLGLVAETIFFYRSVQLLLNHSAIVSLARKIPADDLIALMDRAELKLSYLRPGFGVVSAGIPRTHQFVAIEFAGSPQRKASNYADEIAIFLERNLGNTARTHKIIKAITTRLTLHRFKESPLKEKIIPNLAQKDLADKEFVRSAALAVLKHLVPTYVAPHDFRFNVYDTGQGYAIDTNINYGVANAIYHQTTPPSHSTLTSEYILGHIIDARSDSYFASNYMAEIITTPIYSEIIRLKHFEFLKRRELNSAELDIFQENFLPDVPTLREAINSGACSISDFLKLLDHAERFRQWIHGTNTDAGLVSSYYKAATEKTWADRLPTKSVRFFVAAGLGLAADVALPTGIGTAAGLTFGAADSLYLDRIIKGWRPNQFIDGAYRSFLEKKEAS